MDIPLQMWAVRKHGNTDVICRLKPVVTVFGGHGQEEPRESNLSEDEDCVQLHRSFKGLYFMIGLAAVDGSLPHPEIELQREFCFGTI